MRKPSAAGSGLALGRVRWWRGEGAPRFFSVIEAAAGAMNKTTSPDSRLKSMHVADQEKNAV
jgi:hypothetical protein